MTKTKNTPAKMLRHIGQWVYLPYVLLFVLMFACHMVMVLSGGDEEYYMRTFAGFGYSLIDFSVYHYNNWASRTLIEAVLAIVAVLPWFVWRVLNPVVITVAAWCLGYITGATRRQAGNWLVCGFFVLYRWEFLRSAGWIATTLVYLWPAAMGLLALLPVAQWMRGGKPRLWGCILSLPALLYAANMEQVSVTVLLLLLGLVGYSLVARKRVHWLVWAQIAVCVACIFWALLSPGAGVRYEVELTQWFPNYGMRGFLSNIELALATALNPLFFERDFVFVFFAVLLAAAVWLRQKNWVYRAIGIFPLLVCLPLGFFNRYTGPLFPGLAFFTQALNGEGIVTHATVNNPLAYLPLFLLLFAFVACLVGLYLALGHTPAAFGCMWVFCCGLASRAMLGFSPTVWTSGNRTGFFFALCIIAVACVLFCKMPKVKMWPRVFFWEMFFAYSALQTYALYEIALQ